MIFNEIYSAYYNAVAKIITQLIDGNANEKDLNRIVCDNAFGESMLTILPSLKSGKWQLVRHDMTTPIRHKPTMPLSLVEKQWLRAITIDPRIKLFGVEIAGLDGIEPLFTPADYVIYDKYGDGGPYEDEGYIARFRIILSALKDKQPLRLHMVSRKGNIVCVTVMPQRLEYSEKDDKFRLISTGCRRGRTVNLATIKSCEKCRAAGVMNHNTPPPVKETVVIRIVDDRNALERCLLHFAHFEKRVERIGRKNYLLYIRYDKDDETEMVIRILSFGPMVEVVEPNSFRQLIVERLQRQKRLDCMSASGGSLFEKSDAKTLKYVFFM